MIKIYTEHISARLSYVIEVIFEDLLRVPVTITTDSAVLDSAEPVLNYSHIESAETPYIRPHSLLFEEGIRQLPERFDAAGNLFPVESNLADQDVFAASFFMLSRYEEYWDQTLDQHGRVQGKNSLSQQAGLLQQAMVDRWAIALYEQVRERFPQLPEPERQFQIIPSFDIDVAYAYRGRSRHRRLAASAKDLTRVQLKRIRERKAVLRGEIKDPYDTYAYQKKVCTERGLQARHFMLLGDKGPLDRNLQHSNKELIELIKELSTWSRLGIHPSMGSNDSDKQLRKEVKRLQRHLGEEVNRSRQHFLYLHLPQTYRGLLDCGISEDYTMGYADLPGFRAGTCSPFPWFDLERNCRTELYLIPLTVMDSTLKDYMQLEPEAAVSCVKKLLAETQLVSGVFVALWHNHSINDQDDWQAWRRVFEACINIS